MKSSRIPPPAWMAIFAIAMWLLSRYAPLIAIVPDKWRWLGWCVIAIAPIAPIVANVQFRRAQTTPNPFKPETATTLVTSGVFSWTRNPMYLGLFTLLLGWAIKLGALSSLIAALLFIPLIYRVQIRAEEYALRTHFGADYDRYCRQVNRWVGRRRGT
jgi:protein-S-isoprenylcysteine O-methyltransferase Ste14